MSHFGGATFQITKTTTEKPSLTFDTSFYEEKHGQAPSANAKGTYSFLPPIHLGKRPVECRDMTYSKAKKQCIEWIGERPAYGEFVLIP